MQYIFVATDQEIEVSFDRTCLDYSNESLRIMKITANNTLDKNSTELIFENNCLQSIQEIRSVENDLVIAPALVDIQVNGFAGYDLNVSTVTSSDVIEMVRELWCVGTGFLCPTIVTGSFEDISNSMKAIVDACHDDSEVDHSILGIHLEGPYISPQDGPRGAHPLHHVRKPDWDEFRRLQDVAEGMIRIVTLAPETMGVFPFIEKLVAENVIVAIGHTDASPEHIRDAISVGARLSTHLGNGAHAQIQRHPNYIWEQLGADELWASLIVDGYHLPPSVVKSMIRAKTLERCILISDATALARMPSGQYEFAGQAVELTAHRKIHLLGTEYLAGSAIELVIGVENSVQFAGISLSEAMTLATVRPLKLLGLDRNDRTLGNDFILFEWNADRCEIDLKMTVLNGQVVFSSL